MSVFQRSVRIFIGLSALATAGVAGISLALARQLIRPTRRHV